MSDQEIKKEANDEGSAEVVDGQQPGIRPKTNSQDEILEQHHVKARAPAVPSFTEEIKPVSDDTVIAGNKERKEADNVSSEQIKHSIAQKLSSTAKRQESPEAIKKMPESILLAPMEVERKGSQPIPSDVKLLTTDTTLKKSVTDTKFDQDKVIDEKITEDKIADEKITKEVAELRGPEQSQKHLEWTCNKVSGDWNNESQDDIKFNCMEERVRNWELERKASIGPRWTRTPNSCASGILIVVPRNKKTPMTRNKPASTTTMSGIRITVSKKSLMSASKSAPVPLMPTRAEPDISCRNTETRAVKVDLDVPYVKLIGTFRDRLNIVRGKLKECSKYLKIRF